MTIDKYLNGELHIEGTLYEIPGEEGADPTVYGYTGNETIRKYEFEDLENGMQFLKDGNVNRVKTLIVKNSEDDYSYKPSYYFMHIKKASGISLQKEMRRNFIDHQTFINPTIFVDEIQMMKSKFISGHFARFPIDLFKNNNLKLKTVALFRNPVDRIVSQFAYEYYFHNWATGDSLQPTFENFLDYIYGDGTIPNYVTNLQAKTLCSTVNSVESKRFNFQFLSNNLDANTIFRKIASTGFLIDQHPLNKSLDFIEELDLVGTVDNRNKFLDKLATMLKQDGYGGNMLNSVWNRTKMDTSFIHNNMSPEDLNQIIKNNIYDFKIYEHLLTKGL